MVGVWGMAEGLISATLSCSLGGEIDPAGSKEHAGTVGAAKTVGTARTTRTGGTLEGMTGRSQWDRWTTRLSCAATSCESSEPTGTAGT